MALPTLANRAKVEAYLGRNLVGAEIQKADTWLLTASAIVRTYTKRKFSRATYTARVRPRGHKVQLPESPIVSITSVSMVVSFNGTETVTPVPWSWGGAGVEVALLDPQIIYNGPTYDLNDDNVWAEVVYVAGYDEVPEDIQGVVANMTIRQLSLPGGGIIDSETIGPYTTRYSGSATGGPLSLSQAERTILNAYRRSIRAVELR